MEIFCLLVWASIQYSSVLFVDPEILKKYHKDPLVYATMIIVFIGYMYWGYYAGLFYAITGYEGNVIVFLLYLCAVVFRTLFLIARERMLESTLVFISTLFLILSGGFAALTG